MENTNDKNCYQEGLDAKKISLNGTFSGNSVTESKQKVSKRLTINEIRDTIKAKENKTPFAIVKILLLFGLVWLIYESLDIIGVAINFLF
jgi:hypothetical protein